MDTLAGSRNYPVGVKRRRKPDKNHLYELHVFALDKVLGLQQGFLLNELHHAMEGHILDTKTSHTNKVC